MLFARSAMAALGADPPRLLHVRTPRRQIQWPRATPGPNGAAHSRRASLGVGRRGHCRLYRHPQKPCQARTGRGHRPCRGAVLQRGPAPGPEPHRSRRRDVPGASCSRRRTPLHLVRCRLVGRIGRRRRLAIRWPPPFADRQPTPNTWRPRSVRLPPGSDEKAGLSVLVGPRLRSGARPFPGFAPAPQPARAAGPPGGR